MSSVRDPKPPPSGPHRRRSHKPKGWKAVPMAVKVLVPVCVVILALLPVAKQRGWFQRAETVNTAPTSTSYTPDLAVLEAKMDLTTRTMKGVVRNKSGKTYADVQISYYIRDRRAREAGEVVAKVDQLGPHQSAHFETQQFAPEGLQFVLREVTGNPR